MYQYKAKILKVLDGDTVDIDLDLGFNIVLANQRVRMSGIDTPESRTTDKIEKALGLEAKAFLKSAIDSAKTVVIKTEKMDSSEKYGRILGWVFLDGSETSINEEMIKAGHAWGYLGDTKVKDFDALAKARANYKRK